jgi:hypothetical protein
MTTEQKIKTLDRIQALIREIDLTMSADGIKKYITPELFDAHDALIAHLAQSLADALWDDRSEFLDWYIYENKFGKAYDGEAAIIAGSTDYHIKDNASFVAFMDAEHPKKPLKNKGI